ncbi:MAG: hypothetical protein VX237_03230, partial [Chloroflexota bacterium]|nr:hypothetical protein [Chloroflexota bacterium]
MTPNQEEPRLPPKPPMSPFSPSGDIDYIPMSPLAIALRETYTPTEFKSKGLKKVIGVVAMVAIPFAAPAISASIAASGFLGASATGVFSTYAGSAIVGAGLGAVAAKVTGGDVLQGALGGAIGGGLGGIASSKVANPAWMSSLGGASQAAGVQDTASALGGGGGVAGSGLVPAASGGLVAPATTQTFMGALQGQLASTFTPAMLAEQAIKMGGNLMMEAFVAEDYSEEQLELINKQKAIVDRLEAQGAEVDQVKLTQAKGLLQQALQVSPAYIARQNDIAMRNKYAQAGRTAVRAASSAGIRPNYAQNIERRTALEGAAAGATGYEQGMLRGTEQKTALTQAGLQALTGVTPLAGYYTNINQMYKDQQEQADEELAGWQEMFGSGFAKKDEEVKTEKNKT